MPDKIQKSEAEWRASLTEEQFRVARQKGTERAFTGAYCNTKEDGLYECACCGQPLFDAKTKYDSGTGWPSFWKPLDEKAVGLLQENDSMQRIEVVCSRCDAHLGHVFTDGPHPSSYPMDTLQAFLTVRRDIAKETAPQLSAAELDSLAAVTRGMHKADIQKTVRRWPGSVHPEIAASWVGASPKARAKVQPCRHRAQAGRSGRSEESGKD